MSALIWQDLRLGLRQLARRPFFSSLVVLTLALGIGATTAIFSVVDGVLLRPLPYPEAEELMVIRVNTKGVGWYGASEPEYIDFRDETSLIQGVAAYDVTRVTLEETENPRRIRIVQGTANLVPTLGVQPALGRLFGSDEDTPDAERVVVLSHGLWQREYGGSPDAIGGTLTLEALPHTIIGVMPPGFAFPTPEYQAWVPLRLNESDPWGRNNHSLGVVARTRPGVELSAAQEELDALAASAVAAYRETYGDDGFRVLIRSMREDVLGEAEAPLYLLLGAVTLVLLIVCLNVANLLLVRGEARRRELAIRATLGAGRCRVTGQLMTESLLLAATGGAVGILLAYLASRWLLLLAPATIPRLDQVDLDLRVLVFSCGLTLATGVLFGLAPALRGARVEIGEVMKQGGRALVGSRGGRGGRMLRRTLVIAQLSLSVLLVLGAGLLIRSYWNVYSVDPGLHPSNVLTVRLAPPRSGYEEPIAVVDYYRTLLERVRALPGVRSAAAVARLPFVGGTNNWSFLIEGEVTTDVGQAPAANVQQVTDDYFSALGIAVLSGRVFDKRDGAEAPPVVIINETMARMHWPGVDPVGRRMKVFLEGWPWMEIVGVVADVRHHGLDEDIRTQWYVPHAQGHMSAYVSPRTMTLVVRTDSDPLAQAGPVRAAIREIDPDVPIEEMRTMESVISASLGDRRFALVLLSTFAALALFLAAVGVYGVLAYAVSERKAEIGVRVALGAAPGQIARAMTRESLVLGLLGVGLGTAGGLIGTRALDALLYGVSATDPATYVAVTGLILLVAIVASLSPAVAAARVDPMRVLRTE